MRARFLTVNERSSKSKGGRLEERGAGLVRKLSMSTLSFIYIYIYVYIHRELVGMYPEKYSLRR